MYESLIQQLRGQIAFMLQRLETIPAQDRAQIIQVLIQPFQRELEILQQKVSFPYIEVVNDAKPVEPESSCHEQEISNREGTADGSEENETEEVRIQDNGS